MRRVVGVLRPWLKRQRVSGVSISGVSSVQPIKFPLIPRRNVTRHLCGYTAVAGLKLTPKPETKILISLADGVSLVRVALLPALLSPPVKSCIARRRVLATRDRIAMTNNAGKIPCSVEKLWRGLIGSDIWSELQGCGRGVVASRKREILISRERYNLSCACVTTKSERDWRVCCAVRCWICRRSVEGWRGGSR